MASSDPDSCIPDALKDFVFDLHDSVRTSQIPSEQSVFYSGTFRELTAKYFEKGPWPSPQSVASECSNDTLFLAIYKELIQRHHHSISRPSVHERVEGWHVYRNLFDLILAEADKQSAAANNGGEKDLEGDALYLLPEWCFDILHEFVYQFQGFCQFRTSQFATAAKYAPSSGSGTSKDDAVSDGDSSTSKKSKKSPPNHLTESIKVLSEKKDAWAVETVLFYLHRLVDIGKESSVPAFSYLGLFASVTLSRLECLLGDYTASLSALVPAIDKKKVISPPRGASTAGVVDEESMLSSAEDVVHSVFAARLSVAYHAGVSYLMLRRYKDAARVLGDICANMMRGLKSGRYQKLAGSDQFAKLYDRMIALLAILTHVSPASGMIDESVAQVVRDKHGSQLSKIEAGEEGYEDLFIYACPKFVSPAVPQYDLAFTSNAPSAGSSAQDAYKLQVKHFMNEMVSQQTLRKLRSYMKLYTSISVQKLGRLVSEEEFLSLLLSYKHKMRQLEVSNEEEGVEEVGTISDIHYYIKDDIIHVDEAEKQNRFENYFMSQISQCSDIISNVESLNVNI